MATRTHLGTGHRSFCTLLFARCLLRVKRGGEKATGPGRRGRGPASTVAGPCLHAIQCTLLKPIELSFESSCWPCHLHTNRGNNLLVNVLPSSHYTTLVAEASVALEVPKRKRHCTEGALQRRVTCHALRPWPDSFICDPGGPSRYARCQAGATAKRILPAALSCDVNGGGGTGPKVGQVSDEQYPVRLYIGLGRTCGDLANSSEV